MSFTFTVLGFLQFIAGTRSCAPTQPGGASLLCCPINIYNTASTGMAIFDPALRDCPATAQLICSVMQIGNQNPTTIVINGATEVARGPGGTNSKVIMTCRTSDRKWLMTVNGVETTASSIACYNT